MVDPLGAASTGRRLEDIDRRAGRGALRLGPDTRGANRHQGQDHQAGQGTLGLETRSQLPPLPAFAWVVPVGGGGLASGVTGFLREVAPQVEFRFVEPLGGASLTAALTFRNGRAVVAD